MNDVFLNFVVELTNFRVENSDFFVGSVSPPDLGSGISFVDGVSFALWFGYIVVEEKTTK